MKIDFGSDIHLEFGDLDITNKNGADVLVLAGDIMLAYQLSDLSIDSKYHRYYAFMEKCSREYKNVIMVMGNHEHYNHDIQKTLFDLKGAFHPLTNVHILENETIILDDVTFICGTMWTNFNGANPVSMMKIAEKMNDFHIISNNNSKFTPDDALILHDQFIQYTHKELQKPHEKVVMVTHHCPSNQCIPEKYRGNTDMNCGYFSDLSELILDNPKIKVWICGHTHNRKDYMIGDTRIVNNCRGYSGYEIESESFEFKCIEV